MIDKSSTGVMYSMNKNVIYDASPHLVLKYCTLRIVSAWNVQKVPLNALTIQALLVCFTQQQKILYLEFFCYLSLVTVPFAFPSVFSVCSGPPWLLWLVEKTHNLYVREAWCVVSLSMIGHNSATRACYKEPHTLTYCWHNGLSNNVMISW